MQHPQPAGAEVVEPAVGVDQLAAPRERHGHRVDREVPAREVLLDRRRARPRAAPPGAGRSRPGSGRRRSLASPASSRPGEEELPCALQLATRAGLRRAPRRRPRSPRRGRARLRRAAGRGRPADQVGRDTRSAIEPQRRRIPASGARASGGQRGGVDVLEAGIIGFPTMCGFAHGGEYAQEPLGRTIAGRRSARAAGVGAVLIAVAGYLVLKRPADKSCSGPVHDRDDDEARPRDRRRQLALLRPRQGADALPGRPHVKPPYATRWTLQGPQPARVLADRGRRRDLRDQQQRTRLLDQEAHRKGALDPPDRQPERLRPRLRRRTRLFISNLEPGQVIALSTKNGGDALAALAARPHRVLAGGRREHGDRRLRVRDLYAFDVGTGKTIWQTNLGGEIKAAPAIANGVAYVGDYCGTMSAVRISDGSIKWQSDSQGTGVVRRRLLRHRGRRLRPGLRRLEGRPHLQLQSGTPAKSPGATRSAARSTPGRRPPTRRPARHRLLRHLRRQPFYALDARNGNERWSRDVGGSVIGAASVIGEIVYVANLKTTETTASTSRTGTRSGASRTAPTTR